MKKIMILTIVTLAASSVGCCQGWPRMSWFRGDACNDCATYETTPNYSGFNSGAVNGYNAGVVIPNLPALPGPAATNE